MIHNRHSSGSLYFMKLNLFDHQAELEKPYDGKRKVKHMIFAGSHNPYCMQIPLRISEFFYFIVH